MNFSILLVLVIVTSNIPDVTPVDETDYNIFNIDGIKIPLENIIKYNFKRNEEPTEKIDIVSIINDFVNFAVEQVLITLFKYQQFKKQVHKFELEVLDKTAIALEEITLAKIEELNKRISDELSPSQKVCVEKNRDLITELAQIHGEDLKRCTKEKVDKVQNAEDVIINEFNNIGTIANDFYMDYKKCLEEPVTNCVNLAFNDALLKGVDAVFEIIWAMAGSQLVFPRTFSDLESCGVSEIDSTIYEADIYIHECFKSSGFSSGISYTLLVSASIIYVLL